MLRSKSRHSALFQSTPPRRRRQRKLTLVFMRKSFNPRLRAGGDLQKRKHQPGKFCFNPRLRAGGDQRLLFDTRTEAVSIHASAQEATKSMQITTWTIAVSIHASAQEATQAEIQTGKPAPVSIHASAQEATAAPFIMFAASMFQSTPPRRRRLGSG